MSGWLGCGGLELVRRGLSWRGSVDGHYENDIGYLDKEKRARHLVAESETGTFSGTFVSWCKSVVVRFVGQAKYSQRFLFRSSNMWVSVSDYSGVSFA